MVAAKLQFLKAVVLDGGAVDVKLMARVHALAACAGAMVGLGAAEGGHTFGRSARASP